MKENRHKLLFLGILSVLAIDAATPACAFYEPAAFDANQHLYSNKKPIAKEELENLRGGFVTSNGMVIDFAFSANTLVDGQLINQVVLNTAALAGNAGSLRSILQVGEGNVAFSNASDMNMLPNVLTVVQNNLDNLTLQQLNILDLSVKNMSNFANQAITPEINFQSSMGLAP